MVYEWKQNRFPVKAQVAGEELERIKQKYGGIAPSFVVDESRTEDAALHKCFEWNNEKAAERYRGVQAKEIIRSICVVKLDNEEVIEPTRAFVSVVDSQQEHKYISIKDAMSDKDYQKQVLSNALNELISFKAKYGNLKELAKIFSAIEELQVS